MCDDSRCLGYTAPTRVLWFGAGSGPDDGKAGTGTGSGFKENTMRIAAGLVFAGAVSLLSSGAAWSQTPPAAKGVAAPAAAAPAAAVAPPAAAPIPPPPPTPSTNPNAPRRGPTRADH